MPLHDKFISVRSAEAMAEKVAAEIGKFQGLPYYPFRSDELYPSPTCQHMEPKLERLFKRATQRGRSLRWKDETKPVARIETRVVRGLKRFQDDAPSRFRTDVVIKNPCRIEETHARLDLGESNVLIPHETSQGLRLFMGVQTRRGVHVIRPVAPSFQELLGSYVQPLLDELKKSKHNAYIAYVTYLPRDIIPLWMHRSQT